MSRIKYGIIDSAYDITSGVKGLSYQWLEWELKKRSIPVSGLSESDIVFVSVYSQQGIGELKKQIRKMFKRRKTKPIIIVGGGGCYAPAIFDSIADVCCVGEGANFIEVLLRDGLDAAKQLPEAWVPGETRQVTPNTDFPWSLPPVRHPDNTFRVFASRSCKNRCLFCQTAWESPYRANPDMKNAMKQVNYLKKIKKENVALVTNDGADIDVSSMRGAEFVSARFATLKKIMPMVDRSFTKNVRLGVECVSERLRKAVGKPIKSGELTDMTLTLMSRGVGVRWFMIAGIPGESDSDYEEMKRCIKSISVADKGLLIIVFHAFIPQPASPLGVLPIKVHDDLYYERMDEFRRWFFDGSGFTRRVQIIAPAMPPGRMKRAMDSMAATEAEIRAGWFEKDNPNWRIKYNATPDQMRKIAARYARKYIDEK